ncbi:hypothetical protein BY996DRAFT_1223519 [Phakopsora pachyrhizi]|nr:hypothetical protein BY996DRAFT_1223519 [Phakopsora pachyrhizi]
MVKRRATQVFHLGGLNPSFPRIIPGFLNEISPEIVWDGASPSGTKRAIFRSTSSKGFENSFSTTEASSGKKLSIEIWDTSTNQIINFLDVSQAHKFFIINETFGSPRWNQSETLLVYVAELISHDKYTKSALDKNRHKPDFGEQLSDIRNPAVFLTHAVFQEDTSSFVNQRSKLVYQVTGNSTLALPSELAFGQPVFGPLSDGDSVQIFCTGFPSLLDGRRVGLIYCQNRLSEIHRFSFKINTDKFLKEKELQLLEPTKLNLYKSQRLTSQHLSSRSPRVSGGELYYLSNKLGGPHASCGSLRKLDLDVEGSEKILVDFADETSQESPFPGLYIDQLPVEPFLTDPKTNSKLMVVSSIWGSSRSLITIDLNNGTIKRHSGPCEGSCTVWCTDTHQRVVTVYSQTCQTPQIWIGTLLEGMAFSWKLVKSLRAPEKAQEILSQIKSEIISLSQTENFQEFKPTEIVLTSPSKDRVVELLKSDRSVSLVVAPHGGPHSTSVNEFSPVTATMAFMGYSTAYINYPGSLGFGQKWIDCLTKNLGKIDVESCKAATDHLLTQAPHKYDRVYVNGGSHGGFITAHLTSRYPDMFDAACMRNPVVDLVGTASGGSDIPDWSYSEVGINFPFNRNQGLKGAPVSVDEEDYKTLRMASPISYIKSVKSPTLLLLGDVDRRVSHQQGLLVSWAKR